MKRLLPLFIALSIPSACQAAPDEGAFTQDMLTRFRSTLPERTMHAKVDETLVIVVEKSGDLEEAHVNLHRVYGYCRSATPDDCEAVKQDFVNNLPLKQPEVTKADLRVIVRDQQYVDYLLTAIPAEKRPKYRQIGEGLYALLALDTPRAISIPAREQLEDLGIDEIEAWRLATAQTKAILPEIPFEVLAEGKPVAFQDQEYLASLLADTEAWSAIASRAPRDLFVTAVSDSFVFVAFMPDGTKLNEFKRTVEEDCRAQERCISPYIYRFKNGHWVIAN